MKFYEGARTHEEALKMADSDKFFETNFLVKCQGGYMGFTTSEDRDMWLGQK